MAKHIALLRGINVGGKNILPMKRLIDLLEQNAYEDVRTYLQTGNVIFKHDNPSAEGIILLLEKEFDFQIQVSILKKGEFENAVSANPFISGNGKQVHFYFCKHAPKPNIEKIDSIKDTSEDYLIKKKVFYLYAPNGIGRSKLAANIENCLGVPATGRNLNTIHKILELVQ